MIGTIMAVTGKFLIATSVAGVFIKPLRNSINETMNRLIWRKTKYKNYYNQFSEKEEVKEEDKTADQHFMNEINKEG